MPERRPTVNSVRNPFALISTLILMLIQTKEESDCNKREAEKFKKEVDSLKQEMKWMKKNDVVKVPSISNKNEGEWNSDSSLSPLNQRQMTSLNYDTENPYFETCGIRISLTGHNNPDTVTIQHSLPSDLVHFDNLRREGKDCDMQIINGDGIMNVHKALLSGRIPFFKYLQNPSWSESSINFSEFHSHIIEIIINWAYSGSLTITQNTVQCLMKTASYLLLESIVDECYMFMRRRIQYDDALPLLQFCRAIDYNKNDESLIKFIESNFLLISYTPDFLELSIDDLVNIINRNSLNIDNDEQVHDAVIRWIGKDENRRKLAPRLLKSVKCPRLSSSFLNDIVEKNKWIMNIPESVALINQAQEVASNSLISLKSVPWNCGSSLIFVTRVNEYDDDHDDFTRVDIYNPATNEWNQGQIEYRKLHKDNAVVGDHIYFFGHFWDDEVDELAEGTMVIYDTMKNQWEDLRMTSLVDRRIASTGVIDGIIYTAGGDPDDSNWSKSLTKFDPSNPSAVIGGCNYEFVKYRNDGECYDPATDKWTPIADMPHERKGVTAATLGGEIYVVAGAELTKYSPTSDTWTNLKGKRYESFDGILVASGGALFSCGGDENVLRVERYDPWTDTWAEMASKNEEETREWFSGRIMCALPIPSSLPSPNIENSPISDKANE